jgi:hypothetical protein
MLSVIDPPNLCDRDASVAGMVVDHRDLALADAALEVVLAAERIAALETDLAVYGELFHAVLDALRDLTVRHQRPAAEARQEMPLPNPAAGPERRRHQRTSGMLLVQPVVHRLPECIGDEAQRFGR